MRVQKIIALWTKYAGSAIIIQDFRSFCDLEATKTFDFVAFFCVGLLRFNFTKRRYTNGNRNSEVV